MSSTPACGYIGQIHPQEHLIKLFRLCSFCDVPHPRNSSILLLFCVLAEIAGVIDGMAASGVDSVKLETVELIGPNNDITVERGAYTFFKEDGSVANIGK